MKIILKKQASVSQPSHFTICIEDRLPEHIKSPCKLTCELQINEQNDFYLLDLNIQGNLNIICQRCLQSFCYDYQHSTQLAVCNTEDVAERLMEEYECIVEDYQIDLKDILTDDLHLYSVQKHLQLQDCDIEIRNLIGAQPPKKG